MTVEEKAKESLKKRKGEYWCIKTDNVYIPYTEGYKDGLAEGEKIGKEEQWKATEKAQKKTSARIRVEKENAELKEKLKGFENGDVAWQGDMDKTIKQNLELKSQIEELKKDKEYLDKVNDEQTGVILKLNEQIEKMKPRCKPLCKNYSKFIVMESDCIHGTCKNCDKWEMYE